MNKIELEIEVASRVMKGARGFGKNSIMEVRIRGGILWSGFWQFQSNFRSKLPVYGLIFQGPKNIDSNLTLCEFENSNEETKMAKNCVFTIYFWI